MNYKNPQRYKNGDIIFLQVTEFNNRLFIEYLL